jgi:hypothetical protein
MTRASRRAERQSLGELVGQIDIGRLGRRGHDRAGTTLARVAQIELARGRSMRLDVTGPGIERQRICEGRERHRQSFWVAPLVKVPTTKPSSSMLTPCELADFRTLLVDEGNVGVAGELAEAVAGMEQCRDPT